MLPDGIENKIRSSIEKIPSGKYFLCTQFNLNNVKLENLIQENAYVQFFISSPKESIYCHSAAMIITLDQPTDSKKVHTLLEEGFDQIYFDQSVDTKLIRYYGGRSFNDFLDDNWKEFGYYKFILPTFSIIQDMDSTILNLIIEEKADIPSLLRKLEFILDGISTGEERINKAVEIDYPVSKSQWKNMIGNAKRQFKSNQMEKVVLSRTCKIQTDIKITYQAVIKKLMDNYGDCFVFFFQPSRGKAMFGASPELLFEKNELKISSFALAGTKSRGLTPETDKRLAKDLLEDNKERKEHQIVIKRITETLKQFSDEVVIGDTHVLKLMNVQHLKTDIASMLKTEIDALTLLESMHPTPALGGEPRQQALNFIASSENHSRGWYGSPIGWVDFDNNAKFIVGIRSALNTGDTTYIYAGAGIVEGSISENEWKETELKFQPMLEALSIRL